MSDSLILALGVPALATVVGLAIIYRFVYVLQRGVKLAAVGKDTELVAMDAEHRAVLLVWVEQMRRTLGGAAVGSLLFMNAVGGFIAASLPSPLLVVSLFGISGVAMGAFVAWYARSMMGVRADELADGRFVRAWGPATIEQRGGETKLRTANASLRASDDLAMAVEGHDVQAVDYAPLSETVFQVWDARRQPLYRAPGFVSTRNLPAR